MFTFQDSQFNDGSTPDLSGASFSGGPAKAGFTIEAVVSLDPVSLFQAAEIYAECFRNPPWNENWTVAQAETQISTYLASGADVLIAREQGAVVGLIVGMPLDDYTGAGDLKLFAISSNEYYIADFAVDPRLQGRGAGKQLLENLERLALASGVDAIITRTRSDNTAALRAFLKAGFEVRGTYQAETGGTESERTVMEKLSQ